VINNRTNVCTKPSPLKLGESCTFSAASSSEGWAQHFVAPLASEIHFVPAFFVDPRQLSNGDAQGKGGFGGITDGDFNACCLWDIPIRRDF
jgi:hypothetical protein